MRSNEKKYYSCKQCKEKSMTRFYVYYLELWIRDRDKIIEALNYLRDDIFWTMDCLDSQAAEYWVFRFFLDHNMHNGFSIVDE